MIERTHDTILRRFETLTQAEEFQNGLYDKYNSVKLVSSPIFCEVGVYVWYVSGKI